MNETKPDIDLHIEQLILDGLTIDSGQAALIQAAVEAELSRLLTENGLAPHLLSDGVLPTLNADAVHLAPGGSPARMGTQIAQSVYKGIGNLT